MNLRKDYGSRKIDREKSLRERANLTRRQRKKELRTKLVLINLGLVLVIVMIVLVFKVISINRGGGDDSVDAVAEQNSQAVQGDGKQEVDEDSQTKETGTPEPTATPEVSGAARWIRQDLDPDKPMVALTFDDGPYAPVTDKILNVLKKYDAKATFFCVGNRIPSYTEVVKKAYEQGCQLASHTYEHKVLSQLKKKQIKAQVNKTDAALQDVIGCTTTALRPPGGIVSDKVKNTVKVPMVCWNVDSEDWKSRDTKKILQRCNSIQDGDIVLMHDLYPTTAKAVVTLVPKLYKQGFQMVTVDELFYYKGIDAKAGTVYYSGK